jgi:Flp pilus assembly protein TadG
MPNMQIKMRAQTDSIKDNNCGASLIEFAIVAPVLFLFLIGFIEFAMIAFTNSVLEGATNIGSRIGRTGFTEGIAREDYIRNEIQRLSGGFLDVNRIDINILAYDSFANIGREEEYIDANGNGQWDAGETYTDTNGNGQWDADRGIAGAGGRNAVVLYRVTYPWELFTPIMSGIIGNQGVYEITAVATVRNERF